MLARAEYYKSVLKTFPTTESSYLVVAGATRAQVAEILDVDLTQLVDATEAGYFAEFTAWTVFELPGRGVVAWEGTGYGDPSNAALVRLSADGRAAAVVRDNAQGHVRFGCAVSGSLLFDADEFVYIDEPGDMPDVLRPLFDLVWEDLDGPDVDRGDDAPSPYAVGMAMCEAITGLELTVDEIVRAVNTEMFRAPMLQYPGSDD